MRRYQYIFRVVDVNNGLARPDVHFDSILHWRDILPDVLAKGLIPHAVWVQPMRRAQGKYIPDGPARTIQITTAALRRASRQLARNGKDIRRGFGAPFHQRARRWGRLSRPSWRRLK